MVLILGILWLLRLVSIYTMSGFIHVLLVTAFVGWGLTWRNWKQA